MNDTPQAARTGLGLRRVARRIYAADLCGVLRCSRRAMRWRAVHGSGARAIWRQAASVT